MQLIALYEKLLISTILPTPVYNKFTDSFFEAQNYEMGINRNERVIRNTTTTGTHQVTNVVLENHFEQLLAKFHDSLESVPLKDLHKSAATLKPSIMKRLKNPQKFVHELCNARSVSEFVGLMNAYVHEDYLNPSLLECMIERHGNEETKELMREYNTKLQQHASRR